MSELSDAKKLTEAAIETLKKCQEGPEACKENKQAISHLADAAILMGRRLDIKNTQQEA